MSLRNRIAAIVATILFFVLVGTSTAAALWSTTATVGASVKVANLSASCGSTAMQNASFEDPAIGGNLGYANDGEMPGWRAKDAAGNPVRIEIWRGYDGVAAGTGNQHVELNADVPGTLFQSLDTIPGQTLQWSLMHRGRSGTDTMQLLIGAENSAGVSQGNFSDDNTAWKRYSGAYVVPAGQTRTTLAFKAVSAAGGDSIGNFLDDVSFGSGPCVANTTTVANISNPGGSFRPGDEIEYTSVVTNSGSSFSQSTVYEAVLPTSLAYKPTSITINGSSARTDAAGDDTGNYVSADRKVVARLGTGAGATAGGTIAQNTQTVTVRFRATIPAASAGSTITLTPSVTYANGLASGWSLSATSNTVTFPVSNGADLSMAVSVSPATAEKSATNRTVTWTAVVSNLGPLTSGANTTVTFTLPSNAGISGTATPTFTGTGITCTAPASNQSVCTIAAGVVPGTPRTFSVVRTILPAAVAGTSYALTAVAASSVFDADADNNDAAASVLVQDTVKPSTPVMSTNSTSTAASATVTWAASSDLSGIAGYDLYRNGTLYQSLGAVTTYTDTSVTAWATYTYRVLARDNAGNLSDLSTATATVVPTPGSLQTSTAYKISRTTNDYTFMGWTTDEYCAYSTSTSGTGNLAMTTTCTAGYPNQSDWTFVGSTDGFARMITGPTANPRAWSVNGTGTAITTIPVTGSNVHDWRVTQVGTGYMFESRARPGLCADQTGAGTMGLVACNTADLSQRFAVTPR